MQKMLNSSSTLHDYEIVSIRFIGERKDLRIEFAGQNNDITFLEATNLCAFRLADMGLQNIVSRAFFSGVNDGDEEWVCDRLLWMTSSSDAGSYLTDAAISGYKDKIRKGELVVFILEPSIGAEIVFLCSKFMLFTEQGEQDRSAVPG